MKLVRNLGLKILTQRAGISMIRPSCANTSEQRVLWQTLNLVWKK